MGDSKYEELCMKKKGNEELIHKISSLEKENVYLKEQVRTKINEVADGTDYKKEFKRVQGQLNDAIKTIKYLSNLL